MSEILLYTIIVILTLMVLIAGTMVVLLLTKGRKPKGKPTKLTEPKKIAVTAPAPIAPPQPSKEGNGEKRVWVRIAAAVLVPTVLGLGVQFALVGLGVAFLLEGAGIFGTFIAVAAFTVAVVFITVAVILVRIVVRR